MWLYKSMCATKPAPEVALTVRTMLMRGAPTKGMSISSINSEWESNPSRAFRLVTFLVKDRFWPVLVRTQRQNERSRTARAVELIRAEPPSSSSGLAASRRLEKTSAASGTRLSSRKPLPLTPSPKRKGGIRISSSPFPLREGGWGDGFSK